MRKALVAPIATPVVGCWLVGKAHDVASNAMPHVPVTATAASDVRDDRIDFPHAPGKGVDSIDQLGFATLRGGDVRPTPVTRLGPLWLADGR